MLTLPAPLRLGILPTTFEDEETARLAVLALRHKSRPWTDYTLARWAETASSASPDGVRLRWNGRSWHAATLTGWTRIDPARARVVLAEVLLQEVEFLSALLAEDDRDAAQAALSFLASALPAIQSTRRLRATLDLCAGLPAFSGAVDVPSASAASTDTLAASWLATATAPAPGLFLARSDLLAAFEKAHPGLLSRRALSPLATEVLGAPVKRSIFGWPDLNLAPSTQSLGTYRRLPRAQATRSLHG